MSIETSLDMSLGKTDRLSGGVASLPKELPEPAFNISISYNLFSEMFGVQQAKVEPLKPTETVMLSINTSVTIGIIKKIKDNKAELSLKIPIIPFKGENVAIARNVNNHWRLIGHGEIL